MFQVKLPPFGNIIPPFDNIIVQSLFINLNRQKMGKKIQNYVLDNVIGQGQFGRVYRAINQKTNQVVAIKIIKIQKFKVSPKLQQFTINQIQTLSKIQDTTHVVRFIEILKTANNYYFVYQYCNGGTLEQEIKLAGKFQEEKALNYFKDLLKAFHILSKSNIMHRDIKPSNILLNNGIIKLADFGFCKPLKDARDLSQTMLGSPIYMAPEILKGQIYTMKADIWSLGVVLYEMLYGFCPFEEKTIARLISLIDEASITFPSNTKISRKVEDLLKKMLVKDQFKRMGWQELFAYDLSMSKEEEMPKAAVAAANPNPFSKKTTFTSLITEQVRNRYLTPNQGYRLTNNTMTNQSSPPYTMEIRKKEQKNPSISNFDKRTIQSCLEVRSKISQGINLLKIFLHDNSSKLSVSMCSCLAKKILSLCKQNGDNTKKIMFDKQKKQKQKELRKMINLFNEERQKIEEKLTPLETEHEQVKEPQEILFLKFAEEEGLTQQREGLMHLVELYDYLNGSKTLDCGKMSKKELLEEYQRRIYRKAC